MVCRSSATWIYLNAHFDRKASFGSPSPGRSWMCAWQVGTAQVCWYSTHQVAPRLISFCKTLFRKGAAAWLTSQSQLCQEGARLHPSQMCRCEDKPIPSHLDTQAPSILPGCPTLAFSSSPCQHLAWVRWSPDPSRCVRNLLSSSVSSQRSSCVWM